MTIINEPSESLSISMTGPNNETIRHLCHLFGAKEYFLSMQPECVMVICDVSPEKLQVLEKELTAWCGMNINAKHLHSNEPIVIKALETAKALHNSEIHINLVES